MKEAACSPIQHPIRSMGGLIGGESKKTLRTLCKWERTLWRTIGKSDDLCHGNIRDKCVYGPDRCIPHCRIRRYCSGTSSGISKVYEISDEAIRQALFNAGAVGYLAMRNATVAGAVGGCQAEVGVASAMAASAIVELNLAVIQNNVLELPLPF